MTVAMSQPIAGVSASRETEIERVYPSIASNVIGQLIGGIMGSVSAIPNAVTGGKPTGGLLGLFKAIIYLTLFLLIVVPVGAILAPFALLVYLAIKVIGNCYVVTNRSVEVRQNLTRSMSQQVPLTDVEYIQIEDQSGYSYHRVGDVCLQNAQGNTILTIPAVSYPERLRQIILDARNARVHSDSSLAAIEARA